ncbi:YheC/YheD family protein [Ammoniphilus sp. YIM 78166]|uniref:YheC/YheD family protein n=1 Tax=Ammoniphilus sp. YIM 78166 TaxID=1644106 RepID=UPI00142FD9CC|nr:YheC/YheD family protein [Ammoniphilus sp. YIM 78166]
MVRHEFIESKMTKTQPLLEDPILNQHVPELHWFSEHHLKRMLSTYNTVYIKPDKGSLGLGIWRMKLLNDSRCKLANAKSSEKYSPAKAIAMLKGYLNPKEDYLVQQGINLSTYKGCPFHIRVVLQKIMGRWQVSMTSALVAGKKNAVVTNLARGGTELSVEEVMYHNDQKWSQINTFRELIDLSHQVASTLGSSLPLLVLGLDMGIDKGGKIWFIEANTKPNMRGMRELNDEKSFEKYIQARKWIRENEGKKNRK